MKASNQSIVVPNVQAQRWRPWELDSFSVFARVDTIRRCATVDFAGEPLPQIYELTEIVSALHACYGIRITSGIDEVTKQSVTAHLGGIANAAVDGLRKRGFDLHWRIEPELEPTRGSQTLSASLAIDRRRT